MNRKEIVLPKDIVLIIQQIVQDYKKDNHLEEVVKDGIFDLLESKCTVIYYPFPDEKNRGFYIRKLVKDKLEDFVYINTEKTVEYQVFTAAHELGHIYRVYNKVCDIAHSQGVVLDRDDREYEEKITNRFAAELLMPESMFRKKIKDYADELDLKHNPSVVGILKLIAKLMDYFMSSFNAVRKRLFEVGVIDKSSNEKLSHHKETLGMIIDMLKQDDNALINSKTGVKTISGLRGFLEEAEKVSTVDKSLICKIKADFELEDIDFQDDFIISFSGDSVD